MKVFRITNVTNIATGSRGHFLQMDEELHKNKMIPVGGQYILKAERYEHLPAYVMDWAEQNWIKVHDMDAEKGDGYVAGLRMSGEITPSSINPIKEMKSQDIMMNEEEEIDLNEAFEAKLPDTSESTKPILESIAQSHSPKISQAMQEERHSTDLSPLPGEKPVELDDSSKFTVKAPRSRQPGSVVKTK